MNLYDIIDEQSNLIQANVLITPSTGPLSEGWSFVPHVVTLDEVKAAKRYEIEQARDAARFSDCTCAVGGTSYVWQGDANSQGLISSSLSLTLASVIPCPPTWRTQDNIDVTITVDDLKNISFAFAAATLLAYSHSWALKASLDAATTVEEVAAITW